MQTRRDIVATLGAVSLGGASYFAYRNLRDDAVRTLNPMQGGLYAIADTRFGIVTGGRNVLLWGIAASFPIAQFEVSYGLVRTIAVSPDGDLLLVGDGASAALFDIANRTRLRTVECDEQVSTVAFSNNGQLMAAGGMIWEVSSGRVLHRLEISRGPVSCVAFSPDNRSIALADDQGNVTLFELGSWRVVTTLMATGRECSIAFTKDGSGLLTSNHKIGDSGTSRLRLWDVNGGSLVKAYEPNPPPLTAVLPLPDGRSVLVSDTYGGLAIWDIASGSKLRELVGHKSWINGVAASRDGRTAYSVSDDGTAKSWAI